MLIDCQIQGKTNPKPHHAHPLSHSTSIVLGNNNMSSSCAHAFLFSLKLIKRREGGPACQLVNHPLKQAPSNPMKLLKICY